MSISDLSRQAGDDGVQGAPMLPRGLVLRRADAGDLDGLVALEAGFPAIDRFARHVWARVISGNASVLVIAEEGRARLAGALGLLFNKGHRTARLYSLTIAQDWRGQGLSHALLVAAEAEAGKAKRRRIRLEVRVSNHAAISLYETHGYALFGRSAGWFGDGEDAFLMEKMLSPSCEVSQ
jgi:[ribosomal protein S18]-alanine N-acetyltransferase